MCLQANLALCCKALLPTRCIACVYARLDNCKTNEHLTQLTRCLKKHPDGVSHLVLLSQDSMRGIHQLIDLRCAHAVQALLAWCWDLHVPALAVPQHHITTHRVGTGVEVVMC